MCLAVRAILDVRILDFLLHTSIQARTIPIIWPSFLAFLVVDVLARLRINRMRPDDLFIQESELRWSNISDPFDFLYHVNYQLHFGRVDESWKEL